MAKTKISEFSSTPANNTDIDSINIAEGCAPSNINDAIRELMAQLKDFQTGAVGDSFNGPIGSSTASTGAFTNITASGTLGVTGVATLGAGAILNTPASVTLTNATGLPISTGVSGLGTGVATALAVNVGSAGAPVVNGGALGTPSSGTATNLTGLPLSTGVTGTLPTANGGTNLTSFTSGGVVYASSTSALATGSALTYNGSTFKVAGTDAAIIAGFGGTTKGVRIETTATGTSIGGVDSAFVNSFEPLDINGSYTTYSTSGTERMRLTSTSLYTASGINVGIGTSSPANKLHVYTSSGVAGFQIQANAYSANYTLYAGAGGANAFGLYDNTASAYRYIVDSAGNLGLGTAPSAWAVGKAMEFGNVGNAVWGVSATQISITQNAYFDGSWKYAANGYATRFQEDSGAYIWNTSPNNTSGAGAAISFTQAMTLDASGNLGVGTTSPAVRLNVTDSADGGNSGTIRLGSDATYYAQHQFRYNSSEYRFGTYGAGQFMSLYTAGSERARIDSSGRLLVGLTSANTSGSNFQVSSGVTFPATQSASSDANTLDDYEEGSGTPTVGLTTSGSVTIGAGASYQYTKIGNLVTFSFEFQITATSSPVGAIKVNLPFTCNNYSAGALRLYSVTFTGSPFIEASPANAYIALRTSISASVNGEITGQTGYYYGTVTYRV